MPIKMDRNRIGFWGGDQNPIEIGSKFGGGEDRHRIRNRIQFCELRPRGIGRGEFPDPFLTSEQFQIRGGPRGTSRKSGPNDSDGPMWVSDCLKMLSICSLKKGSNRHQSAQTTAIPGPKLLCVWASESVGRDPSIF